MVERTLERKGSCRPFSRAEFTLLMMLIRMENAY